MNTTPIFENEFSDLFNTSSIDFDENTFLIAFSCASAGVALISEMMACSSCKAKGIVYFLLELVKAKSNCSKAIESIRQQKKSSEPPHHHQQQKPSAIDYL